MFHLTRLFSASALLITVGYAMEWTEPFHLVVGALLLVSLQVFLWYWHRRQASWSTEPVEPEAGLPRAVLLGSIGATLRLGYLAIGFWIVGLIPGIGQVFYDYDRAQTEARVASLESAGDFAGAVRLIDERLSRRISWAWGAKLAQRLYDNWIAEARTTASFDAQVGKLESATAVAQRHALDSSLADALLREARRELDFAGRVTRLRHARRWDELSALLNAAMLERPSADWRYPLAQWLVDVLVEQARCSTDASDQAVLLKRAMHIAQEHQVSAAVASTMLIAVKAGESRKVAFADSVAKLRQARTYDEAVAAIRFRMNSSQREDWELPYDRLLYETLLDAAVVAEDLDAKAATLAEACRVAKQYSLDDRGAIGHLQGVNHQLAARDEKAREQSRPAKLPPGCKAGFLRFATDSFPPILTCDVWVEDADGIPVRGLLTKDFRVSVAGQPAACQAAQVARQPMARHVVLAIDISASVHGSPLTQAKEGVRRLLTALDESTQVRLLMFGDDAKFAGDWTEPSSLHQVVASLGASGKRTALRRAIGMGAQALKDCDGERVLVVFSDGADNAGGPDVAELVRDAVTKRVSIHAVGLRTSALDATTLARLAAGTDGTYAQAENATQLAEQFRSVSRELRRHFYRLAITPVASAHIQPIAVTIGGENATEIIKADATRTSRTTQVPPGK